MIPTFRFPGTAAEARNDDEQGQNCSRLTSPLRETFATKGGFSFSTSLRIFGILREMLIMNFDFEISVPQNAGHFVPAKLPIEKEGQFFRRLPGD